MPKQKLSQEHINMVVGALQEKIEKLKSEIELKRKEISKHQLLIKEYNEEENPFDQGSTVSRRKQKVKGGGWIGKIKNVLFQTELPLTSREILDFIYEAFPDFDKDDTHMGSLSSALKNNSLDNGLFIRHKEPGKFATFELRNKEEYNDI